MTRPPSEPRPVRLTLFYWLPVVLYLGVIFLLSAQQRLQPPIRFFSADKLYHVAEYLILGLLMLRAARATWGAPLRAAVLVGALAFGGLVGVADEYYQSFVPGRESRVTDVLADTAGLALALLLYRAYARHRG